MLLVCIRSYLNPVLRYKYLILDTYHPDTLSLRELGCEEPWLFFEVKWDPTAKSLGNSAVGYIQNHPKGLLHSATVKVTEASIKSASDITRCSTGCGLFFARAHLLGDKM